LPFLSRVKSLRDLIELAESSQQSHQDPYALETVAYSFALAGDVPQALHALDQFLQQLDMKISWQRDMADRAQALRTKLSDNPSEAQKQLEAWEAETTKNLGIEAFR
jgi:hypothetical protein